MGGGGKASAPKQSKSAKRIEAKNEELLDIQLAQSKKPAAAPAVALPPPTPPAAPPPSSTSADVMNAEENARRQATKRKGIRSTLLASVNDGNALGGGQTLLG